jgi:excisionase family DNA binding protein
MTDPLAFSRAEACRYLGISPRHLTRLIAAGKIIARRDPGGGRTRTLIDAASCRAYWASSPKVEGQRPVGGARQ